MEYYCTIKNRTDGFGAQLQTILYTLFYCEKENKIFLYNPIKSMEHNYDNDINFINKVNHYINLSQNFEEYNILNTKNIKLFSFEDIIPIIESNIDNYINKKTTKKYKEIFWQNKKKFNNNKFNISIHIRRPNQHDNRIEGARTPFEYYINIINIIRKQYNNKDLLFHIYSQGNIDDFKCFLNNDVIFHINEDQFETFTGLVGADILVTSASSFSYTAGLITDGIVYYLPFWHKPLKDWIICDKTLI